MKVYEFSSSTEFIKKSFELSKKGNQSINIERYAKTLGFGASTVSYTFGASEESLLRLQIDLKNLMAKYMAEEPIRQNDRQIAQACFQVFPVIR